MLNYVITIAISAFFVPHYLSIFWEPFRTNPWDVIGGTVVIVLLVALNIVGIQESAKLNVFLAAIDFSTQVLLVLLGFVLILSPNTLAENVHFGIAPTWGQFLLAIPVGMIAYTGIETVSNLAEEARDPSRSIPASIRLVALAVFAIYFTLPLVALSALPVEFVGGEFRTLLGLPPEQGGFANDPVLGLVQNLGISGAFLDGLKIYVGVLAATILLIATNAGVIGASRITYSMSTYRQLPDAFRRLHPRFKTPWLSLMVFAGLTSILVLLPGQVDFLGTMYSFGAMLSFTVAHASVIALRFHHRDEELVYRARPNLRLRGIDWPIFAVFGGFCTAAAWVIVVVQTPATRYAGLGWLAFGFVFYAVYRKRTVGRPMRETVRAPQLVLGPSLQLDYRTIIVPVTRSADSEEALVAAARLAGERRATIVIMHVLEVPLDQPLGAELRTEEDEAYDLLDDARALVESYDIRTIVRLARGRRAGPEIVAEAESRNAELLVVGAARRRARRGRMIFGGTVDHVLRASPCRVLVAAGRQAA